MIYVINSFSVAASAGGVVATKAIEMTRKLLDYQRKKWPERDTVVLRNLTGDTTRISWVYRVKSLADQEQFEKTFWQDSGVKAITDEWRAAEKEVGAQLLVQSTHNLMADIE